MSEFDYPYLRRKVKHFLLQRCEAYQRSVVNGAPPPSGIQMAKSLGKKGPMTERRLQKFLSDDINEKNLSITLNDLAAFAEIADIPMKQFILYLWGETEGMDGAQSSMAGILDGLDMGLRRELKATLFNDSFAHRREAILAIAVNLCSLEDADFAAVCQISGRLK